MSCNREVSSRPNGLLCAYGTLIRFCLYIVLMLTLSRIVLAYLFWNRVGVGALKELFVGGLRIDLCLVGMLTILPQILIGLLGRYNISERLETYYYRGIFLLVLFLELITPFYIKQYDTRPDRLLVEYLGHPNEVINMLLRGFQSALVVTAIGLCLATFLVSKLLPRTHRIRLSSRNHVIGVFLGVLLSFAAIRGTFDNRPINPATVAFSSDRMLNTLPLNSTYSLFHALYRMKDEKNSSALYGHMTEEQMNHIVRTSAGFSDPPLDSTRPSLHMARASRIFPQPPHVVIILEESLGARYVGHLGGADLTPNLDSLTREAWTLENLYAIGTRSARGIEAVISGYLPTPARSVVKLGLSQNNFFTLADVFNSQGYRSTFMYGGESHFDNMKGFLLNNGFQHVIDQPQFVNPVFTGNWGVSDEDLFNRLHEQLLGATQPQFIFAFSVTNHTPYEYPEGRIAPLPPSPNTVENAVRYADWAIGDFFAKAKASDYFKNTVFLIVADHDSRVYGAELIPIEHFHIPGLFLGAGVDAKLDSRLVSQIDLAPTLLSLAGISSTNPMLGFDLTQMPDSWKGRSIMQYGDNYGYREGNSLVVLRPHLEPTQYSVQFDDKLAPDKLDGALESRALAHALWPSWAYRNRRYQPYS